MTAYNPWNTPRLKVHAQGSRGSHYMLFRSMTLDSTFIGLVHTTINALADANIFWQGTSFDVAQTALIDSNVFVPVADWIPIHIPHGGELSLGPPTEADPYGFRVSVNGRSVAGHRVRYFLFNTAFRNDRDGRLNESEVANVADVIDAFNPLLLSGGGTLCAIDQRPVVVLYPFLDTNVNRSIQRKARRLG